MAIAAVTGLTAEALIASRAGVEAVATGGRRERALGLVGGLIRRGVTGLISFGIAGGLDPGLASGSLVIGTLVREAGAEWRCDAAWRDRLAAKPASPLRCSAPSAIRPRPGCPKRRSWVLPRTAMSLSVGSFDLASASRGKCCG